MSEYTQRYAHVSHEELYQGVNAGDPGQIEALSAQWSSLKATLDDLSRDLSADLQALAKDWTGDASQEFQRRLGTVVSYSGDLADGMTGIRQGLDMMASELRVAQTKAESPEETDDNDKLLSGAGKGAVFGVAGAVVGGVIGHQQDKAEQEKAHKRMVQVVSKLAEGYDFSAYGRIVVPEPPPTPLPGHADQSDPSLQNGPSVKTPSSAPSLGSFGPGASGSTTPSVGHHTPPTTGTPGTGTPGGGTPGGNPGLGTPGSVPTTGTIDPTGTSLAGATPVPTTGMPTTIGGGPGFGPGAGGPTTVPAGGSLYGAPGVLSTGALAGTSPNSTAAARPGGMSGAENRSAAGSGRLTSGRGLTVDTESKAANRGNSAAGRPAMAGRAGVLGGRGGHDDDTAEGRLTWLTEDEMVWGDGNGAPPPVLGGN
ncbi:WXG100 family type VII secretion target [Micromonospora sp. DT31]|uniref:WXG100 family type VII secretion target n=1 Tax=Micromonospora sp. DT31 TaxID=3393434 RepID=UPI003CF644D5